MKRPRFYLRARAVIVFRGQILLAHAKGASNTFLPGGHIDVGESIPDETARDLNDDIGLRGCLKSQIDEYLSVVEHRYIIDGRYHFELDHVFSVFLPILKDSHEISSLEEHLEFMWADPEKMSEPNLQPSPLASLLAQPRPMHQPSFWATTFKDVTEQDGSDNVG